MNNRYLEYVKPRIPEMMTWYRAGATNKEAARKLGIGYSTLRKYLAKYAELRTAVHEAKLPADETVETALYRSAVGYTKTVKKPFKVKNVFYDDDGNRCETEDVIIIEYDEWYKPDVQAQFFWLNNRRPESWRRNAGKELLDTDKFAHDKDIDEKRLW